MFDKKKIYSWLWIIGEQTIHINGYIDKTIIECIEEQLMCEEKIGIEKR